MRGPLLITGGNGMIGTAVVRALGEQGVEIAAPGREQADLTRPGEASALIDRMRPSTLVHCAWNLKPGAIADERSQVAWVEASVELLEAFGRLGGRHAVVLGTCAEYGWDERRLTEDKTPLSPKTVYGRAKRELHLRAGELATLHEWTLTWARVFWVYGPREQSGRLVPSIISALLAGEHAACTNGSQERDYLYSGDVGHAVAELALKEYDGAVNIASGQAVAVSKIVAAIASEIGRPDLIDWGALPARRDEPASLVGDTLRLKAVLADWAPRSLADGVSRTVAWWKGASATGASSSGETGR